jgi:class 3 adenylate cyclase
LRFRPGALMMPSHPQIERREAAGMVETSDTASETLGEWARDDLVTLAIVFTDIVGSTALGRALGDEQMNSVRRAHFGRSRALLAQHAGREIYDRFTEGFEAPDLRAARALLDTLG